LGFYIVRDWIWDGRFICSIEGGFQVLEKVAWIPYVFNTKEVAELVMQGIGAGVVTVFAMALTGFVINFIIKLGMGNI
jgi:hypothetical protein